MGKKSRRMKKIRRRHEKHASMCCSSLMRHRQDRREDGSLFPTITDRTMSKGADRCRCKEFTSGETAISGSDCAFWANANRLTRRHSKDARKFITYIKDLNTDIEWTHAHTQNAASCAEPMVILKALLKGYKLEDIVIGAIAYGEDGELYEPCSRFCSQYLTKFEDCEEYFVDI